MGHPTPLVTFPVYAVSAASGKLQSRYPYGNQPGVLMAAQQRQQQLGMGVQVPSGALVDGVAVDVTVVGAGTNAGVQQFIGGKNGPLQNGTIGSTFASLGLPGWHHSGESDCNMVINSTRAAGGSKSMVYAWPGTSGNNGPGDAYDWGANFVSLYSCHDIYIESNGNRGQFKRTRWTGQEIVTDDGLPVLYGTYFNPGPGSYYPSINGAHGEIDNYITGDSAIYDGWYRAEDFITPDNPAGANNGSIVSKFTRHSDWTTIGSCNLTGKSLVASGDLPMRYFTLQGYPGNGLNATGTKIYWGRDGYQQQGSKKIIVLANAATWASGIIWSICNWNSWADTLINVTPNQGILPNLTDPLWWHVLDGIGNSIYSKRAN